MFKHVYWTIYYGITFTTDDGRLATETRLVCV
jgi:hypothetical protein